MGCLTPGWGVPYLDVFIHKNCGNFVNISTSYATLGIFSGTRWIVSRREALDLICVLLTGMVRHCSWEFPPWSSNRFPSNWSPAAVGGFSPKPPHSDFIRNRRGPPGPLKLAVQYGQISASFPLALPLHQQLKYMRCFSTPLPLCYVSLNTAEGAYLP